MSDYELRSVVDQVEFRGGDNGRIVASGVAMRYGARSKPIMGKFVEEFRPGAFTKTIQESDVRAHNEHGGPYLGRTGAGTVRLHDSDAELRYEIDLPDTTAGRDTAALLERGDIKGSSIGFRAVPASTTWSTEDGVALRSVGEARLFFVDLTTAPAYPTATAELALRSLAEHLSLPENVVLEAQDLNELLAGDGEDDSDMAEEDGRETPTVFRAPLTSLFS